MPDATFLDDLLMFFKALADANRLRIVGLLSEGPYSVEQLAALLELRPSTVSHHLSRLGRAGLVSARADGYYSVYQLETESLAATLRSLLEEDAFPAAAADVDREAYDRAVLSSLLDTDGRLKDVPAPQRKRQVVLRHLIENFDPGLSYTEREVNEILAPFSEDAAGLRRLLVEAGLLISQEGRYWRSTP